MYRSLMISLLAAVLVNGPAAWAQTDGINVSPDGPEAVKVFAKADSLWVETWEPTEVELKTLSERLGWRVECPSIRIHRAVRGGQDLGYAVITEEQGRFKPITFLVKVSVGGAVEMVLVLVYRESRGDGVKRQRFLKQFRQKTADSPLRLNRDLVGVSGATMSSRGITAGVKRILALIEMRYGSEVRP